MGGQDSDKTEEPTEHKLQEARKKGQVMKSQEVISTCLLLQPPVQCTEPVAVCCREYVN